MRSELRVITQTIRDIRDKEALTEAKIVVILKTALSLIVASSIPFAQPRGILSTLGIGDPIMLNKVTLIIPGPDYTGGQDTWKQLVPIGYVYPVP